jgi:hypothetical protein
MMMKRQWLVWIGSLTVMISSVFAPCSISQSRFVLLAITSTLTAFFACIGCICNCHTFSTSFLLTGIETGLEAQPLLG